MADKRPLFTDNFSANLTVIQTFLGPKGAAVFQRLLERLFDEVVPTICRFPQSGRSFRIHGARSTQTKAAIKKLRRLLTHQDDIREFIMDDYLLLYLVREHQVVFLSIKHHRQLSFNLTRFWQER